MLKKRIRQTILGITVVLISGCNPQNLVKLNMGTSKGATKSNLPRLEEMRRTADNMEEFNKMTNEDIASKKCQYIEYRNNRHQNCYKRELRRLKREQHS